MPYLWDPNLEEDKQEQKAISISGAAPVTDAQGQVVDPEKTATGNYQDVQKYLSENQGDTSGQTLTGKIQSKITEAGTDLTNAGESFKSKVNASGSMPTDEEIKSALANPGAFDATKWQSWQNPEYKGPKALAESGEDYNKAWGKVRKVQKEADLLGTEPGRFTLLDSYFGRKGYGFGQKSLDNYLVQEAKGMGGNVQKLQDQAAQLGTSAGNTEKDLANYAATRMGAFDASKGKVRGAIGIDANGQLTGGGAIGEVTGGVSSNLQKENEKRAAERARVSGLIASGKLDPDLWSKFGFNPGEYGNNVPWEDILGPKPTVAPNGSQLSGNEVNPGSLPGVMGLPGFSPQDLAAVQEAQKQISGWFDPPKSQLGPQDLTGIEFGPNGEVNPGDLRGVLGTNPYSPEELARFQGISRQIENSDYYKKANAPFVPQIPQVEAPVEKYLPDRLYGLNLGDYVSYDTNPLTTGNVMTGDQRSRLNALYKLAGLDASSIPGLESRGDVASYRGADLQKDIGERKAAFRSSYQGLVNDAEQGKISRDEYNAKVAELKRQFGAK